MKRLLIAVLCMGISLGAGAAFKKPKPVPIWAHVTRQVTDQDLTPIYRSVLLAANPSPSTEQAAELAHRLEDPKHLPSPFDGDIEVAEGPLTGHWNFYSWRNQFPVAAIHSTASTTLPYSATVETFCQPGFEHCDMLDWRLGELAAPQPGPAGQFEELTKAWVDVVLTEACTHSRGWDLGIHYPKSELEAGVGGSVELELLYNPCGDVRGAWVLKSSGHRELDRAAVASVQRNRIQKSFGDKGGRAHQTIVFDPVKTEE
jgi:TonB family protein